MTSFHEGNINFVNDLLQGLSSISDSLPQENLTDAIARVFTIIGVGVTCGTAMYTTNHALQAMFGFPREDLLGTILRSTQRSSHGGATGLKLKAPDIHSFSGNDSDWIKWKANTMVVFISTGYSGIHSNPTYAATHPAENRIVYAKLSVLLLKAQHTMWWQIMTVIRTETEHGHHY